MNFLGIPMTLVAFFLMIGPLVFVHELGHYLAGRWCGVKADVFSIGFGREILGWTDKRGTRWKIGWLPMGGYVKFAGDMSPASTPNEEWRELSPERQAETFQSKAVWQRFLIVLAGPLTNFLLAIAIFAGFFAAYGEPRTPPVVAAIQQGSAAEKAGLQIGDRITQVAGSSVFRFEEIATQVSIRPNEAIDIVVDRDGSSRTFVATPGEQLEVDRFGNEFKRGILGISPSERVIEPLAPHQVIGAAVRHTGDVVEMMVDTLWQIITGRRSVKELGGPIKIAQYSGQQAELGWLNFIEFMAMISINLGFINLLPIPLLDGGHLAFYTVEAVRRRPVGPKVQEWAFRSGLALVFTFMMLVTFNDLGSFGIWDSLAGLIGRS